MVFCRHAIAVVALGCCSSDGDGGDNIHDDDDEKGGGEQKMTKSNVATKTTTRVPAMIVKRRRFENAESPMRVEEGIVGTAIRLVVSKATVHHSPSQRDFPINEFVGSSVEDDTG